MPTVVILVWEFPPGPGGIGQHAFSVAHALGKKDCDVHVLTSNDYASREEVRQFDQANQNLMIRRIAGTNFMKYAKRAVISVKTVLDKKPEYLLLSGKSALWLAMLLRLFLPRKAELIAFLHGSEVRLPGRLARDLTYFSLKRVTRIVCVSTFTMDLLPHHIRDKASISILPNGLNIDLFPKANLEHIPSIHNRGFPRLLTVGQLSPRKGQARMINALPALRKRWPDIHYHMIGIDDRRDELMGLAARIGVADHVTIHGRFQVREKLYQAYCSVNVFIMLSENQPDGDVEGFGIAILEANYFGLPAIGAKGCGIEDAIRDGVNGYLVDGKNPVEIAEALNKCLTEKTLQDGARHWSRQHNWDNLIDKLLTGK